MFLTQSNSIDANPNSYLYLKKMQEYSIPDNMDSSQSSSLLKGGMSMSTEKCMNIICHLSQMDY